MIIKGKSRGRALELARHLLRTDSNETVRLFEVRGTVARDVEGALREMEAHGLTAHSAKPLYHASISPEAHLPLNDAQIRIAADMLEAKLGLLRQPRLIVLHRKKGREHLHVVWSRIDTACGRAIRDSWNYRRHEEAARELETAFGHPAVPGPHAPHRRRRKPSRTRKEYEYRQAGRAGRPPAQVAAELTALWQASPGAASFRKKLEEEGYALARGDRRVFVVIDRDGNVHSLGRRLGMRADELRDRLRPLDMNAVPSVAEVRAARRDRSRQTATHAAYRVAAQEMTGRATPPRTSHLVVRAARRRRPLRLPAQQVGWINTVSHRPGPIMRRTARRFPARNSRRYRSARAIITADFAAKIADAFRHARGDALNALLERLTAEREASLRKLAEDCQGTVPRPAPWRARKDRVLRHRVIRRRRRFIVHLKYIGR
ncbi:MAG: hypothetical protein QOF14_1639 [Hyphomicrobiales bacterium]|jgi:hypothetical protein|nr:hypothetical protein [Hyphomicrobiales bacterium]